MHHVFISLPFWIKSDFDSKQNFFNFCKKKKIQIISDVKDNKIHAWTTNDYYRVSVRFKDTAKFNLATDTEFCKFMDESKALFIRLTISGKYDRSIELYELSSNGEFKCLTDRKHNINAMTMVDLGYIVNQTCYFGVEDLYSPEPEKQTT